MKTVQRLSDADSLIKYNQNNDAIEISETSAAINWQEVNGTFVVTGDNYYVGSHYVIDASAEALDLPIDLSLDVNDIFEDDDIGQLFVFSCVVFCAQKSITVNVKLYDENGEEVEFVSKKIQAGIWTPIRSNVLEIDTSNFASTAYKIFINIPDNDGNTVRISTPNLVNDSTWALNPVIQSMRPYIPGFYESYDRNEVNPQYPFFRFIDVLTDCIADTMNVYSEWFQFDSREIIPGFSKNDLYTRSRLTNYKAVYDENLEWLAQFSGKKITKQIYVDSVPIVPTLDAPEFKEVQLYPAIYGRGAGTQESLRTAVGFVLTGNKTVIIGQRAGGDPWKIRVITLASETPNIDIRTSVKAATTANVNLSTGLEAGDTIDNVVLVAGDRVLVKNQSTGSQNGVYVVQASGAAVRATDFDSSGEVTTGAVFVVSQGDVNEKKAYELTTTGTITVGSTALTFSLFAGSPEVLAVAEPARPLGYGLVHEVVDRITLTLGDLEYGILGTAVL
jgi:hypothetical protein